MDRAAVHIHDDIVSIILVLVNQGYIPLSYIHYQGPPPASILMNNKKQRPLRPLSRVFHIIQNYFFCSQVWFPTVQEVLHADWQDVWHSPHPLFFKLLFIICVFNVFTCFMLYSSLPLLNLCYYTISLLFSQSFYISC